MQTNLVVKIFLLWSGFALGLFAVDGKVKVFVKPYDSLYTSQKVTISIELMTDAFSITDAKIHLQSTSEYLVQAPKSASYLQQVDINGSNWQMVHYDYALYPLRAGKIALPPIAITFSASMGYGQPKQLFELKSQALTIDVKRPKGSKSNQFVLVTDHYSLDTAMEPKKKQLIVGDAVVFTVTQKAHSVPDILLKPIRYSSHAQLRVYDKEPVLERGFKGRYDVSRTDSFTFVASGEGNATLPAQQTVWWDGKSREVHLEKIPAMTFEVIPDPQIAIDEKRAEQKKRLIQLSLLLLLLTLLYKAVVPSIKRSLQKRKDRYRESEKGKFDTLKKACRQGNAPLIYQAFYRWLTIVDPLLARQGFEGVLKYHPSMESSLKGLNSALIGQDVSFDPDRFARDCEALRALLLQQQTPGRDSLPRHLNPGT